MLTYLPAGATRYNTRKTAVLTFLDLRSHSEMAPVTVREIAGAMRLSEKEVQSLRVLLTRWTNWRLVKRLWDGECYLYRLTSRGRRRLEWLLPRCEARLGLNNGELRATVARLSQLSIRWTVPASGGRSHRWFYATAPFASANDLHELNPAEYPDGFELEGCWCVVKAGGTMGAMNRVRHELGLPLQREFIQAVVDARIGVVWREK